jgi:hypothetical protein
VYQAVGARGMFAIAAAAVLGLTALALAQHRRAQVS